MKVLFVLRTSGFLRNFEGVIREMHTRGHAVTVTIESPNKGDSRYTGLVADLRRQGIKFTRLRDRREAAGDAAIQVRLGLDYLRYLDGQYAETSKVRARAAGAAPAIIRRLVDARFMRTPSRRRAVRQALAAMDAAAPVSAAVNRVLSREEPDLLLVTPLVELGAPQTDWIRAARARAIPTALAVASWDNLTVKGGLREWPDGILVWNDAQVREALDIHGVPAYRLITTGAHTYDHWFDWRPSRTRAEFCAEVGLPADRPFLLYLCSSPFIAPGEAQFVRDWIGALRSSEHPELRDVGVLVRPHPQHAAQWVGVDVADLGSAVLWPAAGADPVEATSRSDFFDSMSHCVGVVGVNTSAQIESAIAGRDVFTVLDPRFAATQEGTLHFSHLAREDGGLLQVGHDIGEHHAQLAALVRGEFDSAARRERFLTEFVRPHGLDKRAAPLFVSAVEAVRLSTGPPAPAPERVRAALAVTWKVTPWRFLRFLLSPAYRARVIRHLRRRVVMVGEVALHPARPLRAVGDLLPPEERSIFAARQKGTDPGQSASSQLSASGAGSSSSATSGSHASSSARV